MIITYRLSTVGAVVRGSRGDIVTVETLGGLEAHVVVAGVVVLAEAELRSGGEDRSALL